MSIPRILIVEDEEETRKSLSEFLSKRIKCEIFESADGYAAIEQIREKCFDIMLLDIKMPGLSGHDVIKEVMRLHKNTAIIVLTKWDSFEVAAQVKEAGAEYIPKPFSLKVVLGKIEEKLKAVDKFIEKKKDDVGMY